jgi:hypothetical protein
MLEMKVQKFWGSTVPLLPIVLARTRFGLFGAIGFKVKGFCVKTRPKAKKDLN